MQTKNHPLPSRRAFIKSSTTALVATAFTTSLIFPKKTFAANSDTLKVGLIGCGGRGSGAAQQALSADKNVVLFAMGDAFEDRLTSSLASLAADKSIGERVQVDPAHQFVGLDAYKKVIDSGVDVVLLTTPPGFRPVHLKYAVQKNKHVFCEKPVATDAAGIRSVMETVAESKRKKLALVNGFCWRKNLAERAAYKKVHDGEIGDVQTIYATYNTGTLWSKPRQPEWTDMEWTVRNWMYFSWLSGDHIVEQAVHNVDKLAWTMKDEPPAKCIALGGRQVRVEPVYGHIFDHFAAVYEWANGTRGFLFCRQQANCANDNSDTIYGTKGVCHILGFRGMPYIVGENNWKYKGPRPNMYQVEHDELFASIRAGEPLNEGDWLAKSTLMAIMGRMAGYTGQEVSWEMALNSQDKLGPDEFDWKTPISVPPVALPGKTPFI